MAPKAIVAALWIWGSVSLLLPPSQVVFAAGRRLFWLLAIVHAIECLVFLPRLRRAEGSLTQHLLMTFVFGIAHVRTLQARGSA